MQLKSEISWYLTGQTGAATRPGRAWAQRAQVLLSLFGAIQKNVYKFLFLFVCSAPSCPVHNPAAGLPSGRDVPVLVAGQHQGQPEQQQAFQGWSQSQNKHLDQKAGQGWSQGQNKHLDQKAGQGWSQGQGKPATSVDLQPEDDREVFV